MTVDVLTEIIVERPCADVAKYAAEPSNAPQSYANIESVSWQTPPPLQLGSRMTLRNRGEPSGFGKVAAPVLAAAMRRANAKDLTDLKRILER